MPEETPVEETTPTEPSEAAKNSLKALVKEAFSEWAEENKPAEPKTRRPVNFLDNILDFGKK